MPILSRMEKAREVRRRGVRISSVNGGDSDFLERSGKEKVRSSGLAHHEDAEMGGGGSEEEEDHHRLPGGRVHRFKLNGKAFNECDAVDSAAVPRKLRSVTTKRNRETIISPLVETKKHRHASTDSETPQNNNVHSSKQSMKLGTMDRSPKQLMSFSITKDEEEVAETLFALARMFPCDKTPKRKGDRKASDAKTALLEEIKSSFPTTAEEDGAKLPNSITGADHADMTSRKDDLPNLTVKVEPVVDTSISKLPHLPANHKNGTFQLDLEKIPTSPTNESNCDKDKIECVNFLNPVVASYNPYIRNRFTQQTPMHTLPIQKVENAPWPVLSSVSMKQEQVQSIKEKSENVSNGLSAKSCGGYELGTRSLMNNNSKDRPDFVNCLANHVSCGNDASKELTYVSLKGRRSWKKCATHVYITQLIQTYKGLEKNKWAIPVPACEIRSRGGLRSGATAFKNELIDLENGLNNSSSFGANNVTADSYHEVRKGMLQDKKLLVDQLALNTSSFSQKQKQTCEFLSLSPGSMTMKNKDGHTHSENLVQSSLQTQIPRLQSLFEHHSDAMPPHQTRYCSRFPDQIAASTSQQVHLQQFPHFLASQYLGQTKATSNQQSTQQQQQQLWGAQLGQYRPSNMLPYLPKWKNGTQHDSSFFGSGGVHMASMRSSSLDAFGINFTPNRQPLFANIPSSPSPSVGKRVTQAGNVDENGGGLRTDACLQQLLCNAQHS